ncbi:hypothetical protein [Moritella yayanosii]|uniref:Uncharacterized protein n=1 Tax=Moritella yayanosii TaxID=69539 RepID=A0A330LM84_9GAMM|nr:hypothetical protein [Moritella yayanosii]SQD77950.1 protein of unknown function [Moritella yayanosii]
MFKVPRITESFIDVVMSDINWQRYDEVFSYQSGVKNADYVGFDQVAELKIFEEEPLDKHARQVKIAHIFREAGIESDYVDLELDSIPEPIKFQVENEVSKALKTHIKKASSQLKITAENKKICGDKVLIAVNNEFSYLNADNFKRLLVDRCKRDSKTISHVVCVTVEYHQGVFDARIDIGIDICIVNSEKDWPFSEQFKEACFSMFERCLSKMLSSPELVSSTLPEVSKICFDCDGVTFVREAELIPDSRFNVS